MSENQDLFMYADLQHPPNHLIAKIPNPDALRGQPDPILMTRIETAIARERQAYLQEMSRDVQALIDLLKRNASPSALWPLAHELRCMAGTFAYPFLTQVAQVLCTLIKKHQTLQHLPSEVTEVFAHALHRARNHKGPCGTAEDSVINGLRKVAAQHLAA